MVEITDRTSLEAWLNALPGDEEAQRKAAVQIAHRAAMRTLPIAWREFEFADWARKDGLTAMSALRAALTSGVAAQASTPMIQDAAALASAAIATSSSTTVSAYAASNAVAYAADAVAYGAFKTNAATAAFSADIALVETDVWDLITIDCDLVGAGVDPMDTPLWFPSDDVAERLFARLKAYLFGTEERGHWQFWIDWYDRILLGEPQDWKGLLTEVALIEDEVWNQGLAAVGERIAELASSQKGPTPAADSLLAHNVMRAALGRYRFDELHHLMRLHPFEEDLAYLSDAAAVARFLRDAAGLRRSMENFADVLEAEQGIQGGGAVRILLRALEREFAEAEPADMLAVGQVIELGKSLEAYALDASICAEFGPMAQQLGFVVDRLRQLTVEHFSEALLRTAPLSDLDVPDDANTYEITQQLRDTFQAIQAAPADDMIPMSPKDAAAMQALIDSLARKSENISLAALGQDVGQLRRDFNFQAAQLTVTMLYFIPAAKEHAGTVGSLINWIDKNFRGVLTLHGLLDILARAARLM